MRNMTSRGGRIASDVREFGRAAVNGAGEAVANISEKSRQALKAANKASLRIKGYIVVNPVKSVFIALGTGALFGFLIPRRR